MRYSRIATDLLSSLNVLIANLADDPVLSEALRRERVRLINHLLIRTDRFFFRDSQRRTRETYSESWRHFYRLRRACYLAIDDGLLSSRRFDALMLLARRAARRARAAQASSPSPSPRRSVGASGDAGTGAGGSRGVKAGPPGRSPSRTKRIKASTICAWA